MDISNYVVLKFTGRGANQRGINSRTIKHMRYVFSESKPYVKVHPNDVQFMLTRGFKVEDKPKPVPVKPALRVDTPRNVVVEKALISELELDPKIKERLLTQFLYVDDVKNASDTDLLAIKHIGEGRLTEIRQAIDKWNG